MTIGADNTQFQKTAKDTNRKLQEMSQNVKAFSQGITSSFAEAAKSMAGFYAVAKAGTMFQDLIEKNDQFNKSMKEVSTLSDEVANNLDAYKQKILDLTTQIPIGADEAAKALYQINSAGHAGADGMKVLEASAKAAIGGVTDTATAADTITTVLNAYKMSASEAASVSDKLFTAVKLGKTSMGELGASIAQVAPVAASFGVSIDQVLGAIATLTKNGTPTAQAVTQIRAAIVSLSSALGSTYFQTHTLQQAMVDIRTQIPDNNELKEKLGTIEAVNAVLAMTGQNASGAADDLGELAKSAGAAADAYSKMSGGKGNELTKLQNNIMKEMSSLNDTISEVVTNVAHKLNEAFDTGAIEGYIETVKELVIAYGAYKAIAITVAAVQAANAAIMQTADDAIYNSQIEALKKVIALKEAEVTADGKVIPVKKAEQTEREKNIATLKAEAKAVREANIEKANQARIEAEAAVWQKDLAAKNLAKAQKEYNDAVRDSAGSVQELTAQRKLEIAQTEYDTAAKAAETAQENANTTSKIANATATEADAAAAATDTVATGFLTKAKIALTTAMTKLKAVMLSNPYTIALAAIAALGYAIYKLVQHFQEAAEAQKKFNQQIYNTTHAGEALKKTMKFIADDAAKRQGEAIADLNSKYKTLQTQWNALGNDLAKKKQFIIDNASAFHSLGFEVSSVDDAEKLLVKNTTAVVAAFEARAKAAAAQELMTEAYKKKIQAEQKVMSNTSGFRSAFQSNEKEGTIKWSRLNDYEREFLNERYKNNQSKKFKQKVSTEYSTDYNLSEDAAKALDEYNRKRMQQRREEGLKSIEEENGKTIKQYEKYATDAAKAAEKAMNAADVKAYKGGSDSNTPADTKNKAYWEAQRDAVQKQIDDLDSKASDFKEKKAKLEAEKAKYLAEIAKYDDPSKGESKRNKTKEEQEKQIEARKELNQELLEMQAKNNDDQIALMEDGHNKRMREISNEYSKEQNEISKTALQWAKQNKDAGLKGDQAKGSIQIAGAVYGGLTDEQQAELEKAIKNAQDKMEKSTQELLQSDIQYMREYLKEYGTFQQQRLAIAEEYDEKIAKLRAGGASEAQIGILEEQKTSAIKKVDEQENLEIFNNIDWEGVFGNLEGHTKNYLTFLREQLRELLESNKLSDIADIEKVQEKISELNSYIADKGGIFGGEYLEERARLKENRDNAHDNLDRATAEYAKAGTNVETLKMQGKQGTAQMTKAEAELEKARTKVANATAKAKQADDALNQTLIDKVAGAFKVIKESNVFANLEELPNLFGELGMGGAETKAQKGLDGLNDAAGAVTDYMSGNYIGALMKGASAINNFGEALGVWSNSNRAEIEAENNRLELAMDVNTEAINKLTAAMEKQNPEQAYKSYEQAVAMLKQNEEAEKLKMRNNASMYDGGHSLNEDLGTGKGVINRIYAKLGKQSTNGYYKIQDLIRDLTAKDWNQLYKDEEGRALLKELGERISGAEDEGNYNGLFKDIIDFANKYSEEAFSDLAKKFQESVTSVSFDSLYDNFVSSLMDMDKSAKDFSNDFEGYLRNAVYQAMVADKIKPLLENWMGALANAMQSKTDDGRYLSGAEIHELMKTGGSYFDEEKGRVNYMGFEAIEEEAFAIRDMVEELGLYNGKNQEQSATANGIESITADQADQLIGRMTAIQIAVEADKNTMEGTLTQLIMISSLTTQGNAYLSDILSQHAIGNSYLEDIAKYSKAMSLEIDGKMQKIVDGLNRL